LSQIQLMVVLDKGKEILLTVLMILPIAEPTESDNRMMKRKIICVLTIRSTAVRLIGVALHLARGRQC
jgi:hypothetical protein